MSSPGFFSSQRPIASPRDQRPNTTRRKALHQRSKSQQNEQQQQQLSQVAEHPTVRLVNPSPSPPSTTSSNRSRSDGDESKENWQQNHGAPPRLPPSALVKRTSVSNSSISAAGRDYGVSDRPTPANEAQRVDNASNITLLPNNSQHELSRPAWHRLSTSSGYSQTSTLHESEIASSKKSGKSQRFSSFSQISTLRGTPTPTEQENRERAAAAEGEVAARSGSGSALALQTLQETSPERPHRLSTIRPVPASDTSTSSPIEQGPGSQSADDSPPRTAPSSDLEQPSTTTPRRRTYSTGSIPSPPSSLNTRDIVTTPASHLPQERPESQAISEATFPPPSSPNFIAYTPDSVRPISRGGPIRGATSIDSINSRLQHGSARRPQTAGSLATKSSWASTESNDPLPPLHIPKKRLRHKAASESLSTQASIQASSPHAESMAEEEIDTLPYPKRPFSSHLSTIASESEQSRTASQHLSHFSLGSGVLTGDDASSLPLSPVGHRRTGSAPAESIGSNLGSPGTRGTSSSDFQEDVGDMTLGIYREASAVPQPLFRAKGAPNLLDTTKKYDGPLPPIPPIPKSRDSEEDFDTLSALQAPGLRQKRSGYSLRQRDNNTPSHSRQQSQISYVESERFSQGSSLFPVWARNFYSGTHGLKSKVSLGSLSQASQRPPMHRRNDSSWTERSITSRLGTGYSNAESGSPTSSHFLPAIFRPRIRKRQNSQHDSRSSNKVRKSGRSKPSHESRRDSLAIFQDPLPQSQEPLASGANDEEVLPSGQPRWGKLKGSETSSPEPGRRLPRKYSKQRLWDTMEFPRPMTKDRLSDFHVPTDGQPPRLAPSKRTSQNRLSAWQAPSFVSSLDTLITSRCNRQILLFALGFICPLMWMLGALLPLPKRPMSPGELEKGLADSQDDVAAAMMKHEAGDAERRWKEERTFLKARWWRMLNRVMSVVGLLVIGAIIALAVVATT
ncbi:hypothetical protein PRZ48_004032 [Zasmidium cellare]|uniref:Serine-rich protein n=1 Tax=Zasmidium cellare TaxID=395010 RepID=A0ABR0EWQ9_ZASCE|nr:hypothetical protein PRZ48_004032 [Zasmidium cellare]